MIVMRFHGAVDKGKSAIKETMWLPTTTFTSILVARGHEFKSHKGTLKGVLRSKLQINICALSLAVNFGC